MIESCSWRTSSTLYKIKHDHLHVDALQIFEINQFIQGAGSLTKTFRKVFKVCQLVCETLSLVLSLSSPCLHSNSSARKAVISTVRR